MNEAQFQGWVLDVAARFGWRAWHVPYPVRPVGGGQYVPEKRAKGLPDLFLLHEDPPRMIVAELKAEGGKPTPEQLQFLNLVSSVGEAAWGASLTPGARTLAAYVWTPRDADRVETILRSKVLA